MIIGDPGDGGRAPEGGARGPCQDRSQSLNKVGHTEAERHSVLHRLRSSSWWRKSPDRVSRMHKRTEMLVGMVGQLGL